MNSDEDEEPLEDTLVAAHRQINADHVMQLMKLLASKKNSAEYELSQRQISVISTALHK